jgi:hypothetical protein
MNTEKIYNTAERICFPVPDNGTFHTTVVPCTGDQGYVRFNMDSKQHNTIYINI